MTTRKEQRAMVAEWRAMPTPARQYSAKRTRVERDVYAGFIMGATWVTMLALLTILGMRAL